jgi:hypothetical protein
LFFNFKDYKAENLEIGTTEKMPGLAKEIFTSSPSECGRGTMQKQL